MCVDIYIYIYIHIYIYIFVSTYLTVGYSGMRTGRVQCLIHELWLEVRERGVERGFPFPGNGGSGVSPLTNFLLFICWYTSFNTNLVVTFISLVVAFKILYMSIGTFLTGNKEIQNCLFTDALKSRSLHYFYQNCTD